MSVEIYKLDKLELKLIMDDIKLEGNQKLKGKEIKFKPSMIDSELGSDIYFTRKFELSAINLSKAGFNNDVKTQRQVLTSKTKMQEFLTYMNKNKEKTEEEKNEIKNKTTESSIENLMKERTQYEDKQIIDKLKDEFSIIKNELTKKGFKATDKEEKDKYTKEKREINENLELLGKLKKKSSSPDFDRKEVIDIFDKCIKLKDEFKINIETLDFFKSLKELYKSPANLYEKDDNLNDAEKYLINKDLNDKIKNKESELNNKSDDKPKEKTITKFDEKNLNFIKGIFFKNNEPITISPNTFIIYSSDIANELIDITNKSEEKTKESKDKKSKDKKSKDNDDIGKQFLGKTYSVNINIKLIDSKEKLSKYENTKIGCSERAKRIEKEAFELFGISFNLLQSTNRYNPIAVFEKITRTDQERKKEERKKELDKKREKKLDFLLKKREKEDKAVLKIINDEDEDKKDNNSLNGGARKRRTKRRTKR